MSRGIHHINYMFRDRKSMSLRFYVMVIGLFVLLFVVSAGSSMAWAQQNSPPMSLALPVNGSTDSRKSQIDLELRAYEAGMGDLSLCADNENCLRSAKQIKSFLCVAQVCDGTDKTKKPTDCLPKSFSEQFSSSLDQINLLICPEMISPSALTRQALLKYITDTTEDSMVEAEAKILPLKGSAESCQNHIKDYVGPYGPKWKYQWYLAMSGCRILAHERTRLQEENDFYIWLGVLQGVGNCSDIKNSEMRKACSVPEAASPLPPSIQPSVNAK